MPLCNYILHMFNIHYVVLLFPSPCLPLNISSRRRRILAHLVLLFLQNTKFGAQRIPKIFPDNFLGVALQLLLLVLCLKPLPLPSIWFSKPQLCVSSSELLMVVQSGNFPAGMLFILSVPLLFLNELCI